MRTKIFFHALIFAGLFLIAACTEEIDDIKPEIELTVAQAFPVNCDTIYFGEDFNVVSLFLDNTELGSYSIDIHHNFDHHSHSTEVEQCSFDEDKTPVNPFTYIQDFSIPTGQTEFETNETISVPESNNNGTFDEGDYHFFISLTDKEGWSAQKGLSIKMLYRTVK